MKSNDKAWVDYLKNMPPVDMCKTIDNGDLCHFLPRRMTTDEDYIRCNVPVSDQREFVSGIIELPVASFTIEGYVDSVKEMTRHLATEPNFSGLTIRGWPAIIESGAVMRDLMKKQYVHALSRDLSRERRIEILSVPEAFSYIQHHGYDDLKGKNIPPHFSREELESMVRNCPSLGDSLDKLWDMGGEAAKKLTGGYNDHSSEDAASFLLHTLRIPSDEELTRVQAIFDDNNPATCRKPLTKGIPKSFEGLTIDDWALMATRQNIKGMDLDGLKSIAHDLKYGVR